MKLWVTEFKAINQKTGEMATWGGENVEGISMEDAQQWCYKNAGHLKVIGELVAEIPCDKNHNPIWDEMVDYESAQNN